MPADVELIQITDAALADAYQRAGNWMACRPGCHQCCIGVFAITTLDAERLRGAVAGAEPGVRERVRQRAAASRERLRAGFPGDAATGELFTEAHHEMAFEDFANDEPCPVLDPVTGTCDLYAARPIPCRTFGPPMPNDEGGLAVCELCFVGAPESEVARCAVDAGFLDAEADAVAEHEARTGKQGLTVIAFALSGESGAEI
ncbi:MAG TPA: YkgJ family cysteine cluster protein [Acidobacteriaceae bacterium]